MAAPMTSENWPQLLLPGLRKTWDLRLRGYESVEQRTKLFSVDTSIRSFEQDLGIGALGSDDWNFEDSQQVQYDGILPGYAATYTHREFAKGMIVRRKLMDDNLYGGAGIPRAIGQRVQKLADAAFVIQELAAAEVFNNAFTDSGTSKTGFQIAGADAVCLCSTVHPLGPNDTGTTLANEGTQTLGIAAIKAARYAARKWTDDRGNITPVALTELMVPIELEDEAAVIVQSMQVPGSANNDDNVTGRRITTVRSWEYLTDTNAWFLMDPVLRAEMNVWFDRIPFEFDSTGDFDTLQAKFRAYGRFSRGFNHWAWIYGNNPS